MVRRVVWCGLGRRSDGIREHLQECGCGIPLMATAEFIDLVYQNDRVGVTCGLEALDQLP